MHLANTNLSYSTIRTYLSAISFAHKILNANDPTTAFSISKTLQGIRNLNPTPINQRLPITKSILHRLLQALPYAVTAQWDKVLWQAVYLLAYHGCLRAGEITLSKNIQNVIQLSQVISTTQSIQIHFWQYKHSQHHKPVLTITAQPTGVPCPVSALQQYLLARGPTPGQLFINHDHSPTTIEQFGANLKTTTTLSSLPPHQYTTHSFRIGKASDMAAEGQPDQLIRRAGRWKSSAYMRYLRPDNITLPQ